MEAMKDTSCVTSKCAILESSEILKTSIFVSSDSCHDVVRITEYFCVSIPSKGDAWSILSVHQKSK